MRKPIAAHYYGKRRRLSKAEKQRILAEQRDHCFYCGIKFDVLTQPEWDHVFPFSYYYNNHVDNFAAACHACNAIKGSKMFDNIQQAMQYVRKRRKAKGLALFELFGNLHTKKEVAEVLLSEMPDDLFLEDPRNCSTTTLELRIKACRLAKQAPDSLVGACLF